MSTVLSFDNNKELRQEQITLLVKTYYDSFDFLKSESLSTLTDNALRLFLDSDLTMDEINDEILIGIMSRKKVYDDRYNEENVRKNHEEIYKRLEQVTRLLNEAGCDYQLAGSLCAYLKYDTPSDRCHDDLDFNINEEDFDKFKEICLAMGLSFEDRRLHSPRILKNDIPSGEHEVIARDRESDFHIGIFPFERLEDGTVIVKGYYHDEYGDSCVSETIFLPDAASEIFGHDEIEFRGSTLNITPPEYVYILKSYTRSQKDLSDIEFMEERIDKDRLAKLKKVLKDGKVVQNVPVTRIPDGNVHNQYSSSSSEINDMLIDNQDTEGKDASKKDSATKKSSSKVLVKKNDQGNIDGNSTTGEEGYINNVIISTLALITFSLCAIGLIITYFVTR